MSRKVLACVGRECGRETRRLGARHWDIRKRSPCGVVSNYFPRGPGLIAFAPPRFMNLILFEQPFESIRLKVFTRDWRKNTGLFCIVVTFRNYENSKVGGFVGVSADYHFSVHKSHRVLNETGDNSFWF